MFRMVVNIFEITFFLGRQAHEGVHDQNEVITKTEQFQDEASLRNDITQIDN